MSLRVNFMGLDLKNPLIVAAGPWNRNYAQISRSLAAGAAAVITETITNEIRLNVRPRLYIKGEGLNNIKLYSDESIEQWMVDIGRIKQDGGIVIASILAHSPSEMAYVARRVEKAGADAIELGVASPHGEGIEVITARHEALYQMVRRVTETVDLPVMVKFSSHDTNLVNTAKLVEAAGASGISAIDTVRAIIGVDIETGQPYLPTYGGYSGAPIRPIGLAAVATIAQSSSLDLCGIGGVDSAESALEYMMLGAKTIQMGTGIMVHGYERISEILANLEQWQRVKGYQSPADWTGVALSHLKSFDEIELEPYVAVLTSSCSIPECHKCVKSCFYEATVKRSGNSVEIFETLCTGCGACPSVCPGRHIALKWRG